MIKNLPANARDVGSIPESEHYLEKEMATLEKFALESLHGRRSLVSYIVHGVAKSQTRLSD